MAVDIYVGERCSIATEPLALRATLCRLCHSEVSVDYFGLFRFFTSFFGFSGDGLMKETRFADVDIPLTVYWRSLLFPPFQDWLVWAGLC